MNTDEPKQSNEESYLNYSYEDWLLGKFVIIQSVRHYSSHLIEPIPKLRFDQLNINAQALIREEQEKLFNSQIEIHSSRVIKTAQELLRNSKKPKLLIDRTIERLEALFDGKYKGDSIFYSSKDSEFIFNHWTYQYILDHYNNYYVGGKTYDFLDVPASALNEFLIEKVQPEVLVYVYQNLLNHLENLDISKIKAKDENSNEIVKSEEFLKLEAAYVNEIFENEFNYKFFRRFAERYVIPNKQIARYSTIYHILKENYKYKLISPDVKNARFAKFLCDIIGIEGVTSNVLRKELTESGQAIFSELLIEFEVQR